MISLISRLWWRRFLPRNARPTLDLETFPGLSPSGQRLELARRLLAQIRYFGGREDALPEWKEAAGIGDPEELWRVWPTLPILTKRTLQERFPAAETQKIAGGRINSTGGSTGEPTRFVHDAGMQRAVLAGNIYTRGKMGWKPGMATVIVWGSERDIGKETGTWKSRLLLRLLREHLVDGYRLSGETVDRVVRLVRSERPVALYGFTTMLEYVARAVVERGLNVPPGAVRCAWNGGEMLFPEQARVFEQAFGAPLLNRYGGRELSTIACQHERGGPLWVLRPWVLLELLDENGRPAAPGETGRVVATSTLCRGTPFLRYDMEDLGLFDARDRLESGVAALRELVGRRAGVMKLADGRIINNLYWNHLLKEFHEVRQFQVVYRRSGEICVWLVGAGMTEAREAELRARAGNLLAGIPLKLTWTEEIPRTREGKLVQVIRE